MGGTLALAGHLGLSEDYLDLGEKITETCWNMYKQMPTGLSPEIVFFNTAPNARDDLIVKVILYTVSCHSVNLLSIY